MTMTIIPTRNPNQREYLTGTMKRNSTLSSTKLTVWEFSPHSLRLHEDVTLGVFLIERNLETFLVWKEDIGYYVDIQGIQTRVHIESRPNSTSPCLVS